MAGLIETGIEAFDNATIKTISNGTITLDQSVHIVAAQTGSTDDLNVINVSYTTSKTPMVYLRADIGDDITMKDSAGNLLIGGDADLDNNNFSQLLYDPSTSKWSLSSNAVNVSIPLAILSGGTGQTTQTEGFDALAPTTTESDIMYHDGSDNVRLAKGTAGQALMMNSGATAPEWGASTPSGGMIQFGGAAAPSGWLICDGAAVNRTTYAALFAVISTTFGVGDGSTTFNVPDMRDNFPVGAGTTYSVGDTGGEATHTLITSEMPAHTHNVQSSSNNRDGTGQAGPGSATTNSSSTGGDGAHENRPPYLGVNVIIKT